MTGTFNTGGKEKPTKGSLENAEKFIEELDDYVKSVPKPLPIQLRGDGKRITARNVLGKGDEDRIYESAIAFCMKALDHLPVSELRTRKIHYGAGIEPEERTIIETYKLASILHRRDPHPEPRSRDGGLLGRY